MGGPQCASDELVKINQPTPVLIQHLISYHGYQTTAHGLLDDDTYIHNGRMVYETILDPTWNFLLCGGMIGTNGVASNLRLSAWKVYPRISHGAALCHGRDQDSVLTITCCGVVQL